MTVSSILHQALLASTLVLPSTAFPLANALSLLATTAKPIVAASGAHAAASSSATPAASSSSTPAAYSSAAAAQPSAAGSIYNGTSPGARKLQYGGVNIAGFEFGCDNNGTCSKGTAVTTMAQGQGLVQMQHFVSKGMNAFRLPVAWQYLTGYTAPNKLDATNFGVYNQLVQACLTSDAALCIIDLHNYARWNGHIIGQGGPSDMMFAKFWAALAAKYAGNSKVAFDIMNEPHELNMTLWKDTAQAAVNAIRGAGANNMILLSGTDFAAAGSFPTAANGNVMLQVHNPNGGYDNIVMSVHQYLDSDNSGKSAECSQGAQAAVNFKNLASFLRSNGNRKAMITETGAGNTQSCLSQFCQMLDAINDNADVFLGATTWASGAFAASYQLAETPSGSGSSMTDTPIVQTCVIPKLGKQ